MKNLLAAALLLAAARPVHAQGVVIGPTLVIVDARIRTTSVVVYNPNTEPVEVALSTFYGYPVTDSLGQPALKTVDKPDSSDRSAVGWVQVFPRRFTLAPKADQTVRVLVSPPAGLADGEYWGRLVIASKAAAPPVQPKPDSTGVSVTFNIEVRAIIPIIVRVGKPATSVTISDLRATVMRDSLVTRSRIVRHGSAAYLGTILGELVDSTGKVRSSFETPTAVYYEIEPRLAAPLKGLPSGSYWLRYRVDASRNELGPGVILRAPPAVDSIPVRLP